MVFQYCRTRLETQQISLLGGQLAAELLSPLVSHILSSP